MGKILLSLEINTDYLEYQRTTVQQQRYEGHQNLQIFPSNRC